jgi:hypothetical protein
MAHKFIAGRQVLDSGPHPKNPGQMRVKFRCLPRLVDGEMRFSVWKDMMAADYRKKLYFQKPPATKQIESTLVPAEKLP